MWKVNSETRVLGWWGSGEGPLSVTDGCLLLVSCQHGKEARGARQYSQTMFTTDHIVRTLLDV